LGQSWAVGVFTGELVTVDAFAADLVRAAIWAVEELGGRLVRA